jgi:hypothetical protein
MTHEDEINAIIEAAADEALAIWQNGSNDDVWDAVFKRGVDVAGELLEIIRRVPDFTVGDLTHEQCVAAIERRYPILGPNPGFRA